MDKSYTKPSDSHDYYSSRVTWRSFAPVHAHLNSLVSGDSKTIWWKYFKDKYGVFDTGFFFNCGNGWVERGFFRSGIIKRAIGFDISPKLLEIARAEANKLGMPAQYSCTDTNKFVAEAPFCDLVVNNGAGHHVAYIDHLKRELRNSLHSNGLYLLFDYTGPHRNQYSWSAWSRVVETNDSLPRSFQRYVKYPHMKTLLALDPTEAIHSDLQMDTLKRYFDIVERTDIGGAIAYPLLHKHATLFEQRETPLGVKAINMLIEADRENLAVAPENNLFTFCVAKPKKNQCDAAQLEKWTLEEVAREKKAEANGGRYYPPSPIELIYNEIGKKEIRINVLQKRLEETAEQNKKSAVFRRLKKYTLSSLVRLHQKIRRPPGKN